MSKHVYLAAIAGAAGVTAGAFGAHALKATLTNDALSTWNTAVLYNLVHAPALLAASLYCLENRSDAARWLARANVCWAIGIVLFSGSLYWLSLGGPRGLGPITPIGGVFLILGWGFVIGGARSLSRKEGSPE